jgi:hypothetical protein
MFESIKTLAQNLYSPDTQEVVTKSVSKAVSSTAPAQNELFLGLVSNINIFVLAFSIFYSVVLYMNFYYWRLYRNVDRLHHEAKGVKSIQDAWWIWFRYIHCLVLFTLISNYNNFAVLIFVILFYFARLFVYKTYSMVANGIMIFEILAIFAGIILIRSNTTFMGGVFGLFYCLNLSLVKFRFDLTVILESVGQGFGQIGWSDNWPNKTAKFLRSFKLKDAFGEKDSHGEYKEGKKPLGLNFGTAILGLYLIVSVVITVTVTIMGFMS